MCFAPRGTNGECPDHQRHPQFCRAFVSFGVGTLARREPAGWSGLPSYSRVGWRRPSRHTVGIAVLVAGHLASHLFVEENVREQCGSHHSERGGRCGVRGADLGFLGDDRATAQNSCFDCGGTPSSARIRDFSLASEWHYCRNSTWNAEVAHRPGAADPSRSFTCELGLEKRPQVSIDLDSVCDLELLALQRIRLG